MSAEKAFQCDHCKGQVKIQNGQKSPECCGQAMKSIPMDQCTLATTAEHSRLNSDDEPCNDGRGG